MRRPWWWWWRPSRYVTTTTDPHPLHNDIPETKDGSTEPARILDTYHAVLIDSCTVAGLGGGDYAMQLSGVVRYSGRRVDVLFLCQEQHLAMVTAQLLAMASRAGITADIAQRIDAMERTGHWRGEGPID